MFKMWTGERYYNKVMIGITGLISNKCLVHHCIKNRLCIYLDINVP